MAQLPAEPQKPSDRNARGIFSNEKFRKFWRRRAAAAIYSQFSPLPIFQQYP
jgi:hypothetical protein